MEIRFSIGGIPAQLQRNALFGGMKLIAAKERVWLQHPLQLSTHLSFKTNRSWERTIAGHRVRVEKTRPLLAAGVRRQAFRVFVDDKLVAESNSF